MFKETGLFLSTTKTMIEYLNNCIDKKASFELTKENTIHYFLKYLSEYGVQEIKQDWNSKVGEEDYVLMAGDMSWALKLEEASRDLEYLSSLRAISFIFFATSVASSGS